MRQPIRPGVQKAIVLVGVAATSAALLGFGMRHHDQHQQAQQNRSFLEQAEYWQAQANYQGCLTAARMVPADAAIAPEAEQLEAECQDSWITQQFSIPQALAQAGRYPEAIAAVQLIPGDAEDQRISTFIDDCSSQMLQLAQRYYLDPAGRLNEALAALNAVPASSRFHQDAVNQSQQWQAEWSTNQTQVRSAEIAIGMQNLADAETALRKVTYHPFWNAQVQQLIQQMAARQHRTPAQTQPLLAQPERTNAIATVAEVPLPIEPKDPMTAQAQSNSSLLDLSLDQNRLPIGKGNLNSISLLILLVSVFLAMDQRRCR